ncbi:MAG: hypothetical protein ABL961_14380 [Vicinamibacterales bacterium]
MKVPVTSAPQTTPLPNALRFVQKAALKEIASAAVSLGMPITATVVARASSHLLKSVGYI